MGVSGILRCIPGGKELALPKAPTNVELVLIGLGLKEGTGLMIMNLVSVFSGFVNRVVLCCALVGLVFVSGAHAKPLSAIGAEEQAQRLLDLQHLPWNGKSTTHDVTREGGCILSTEKIEVWDPLTNKGLRYIVKVQRPAVNTKVPVVFIIPTIQGTHKLLEPHIADELCAAKMASVIAQINDTSLPDTYPAWGLEDIRNRSAVLALKTMVDWAEKVPAFDSSRIGMMGLSLGGITTGMMVGLEPRLRAAVMVVGGGNMPFILTKTDQDHLVTLRQNRMKAASLPNLEAHEDALRLTMKFDPVYFANRANRGNILMVMAENDVKVPYVSQRELFAAFGGPNGLTFTGGHVETIVKLSYLYMDRVTTFFNQRFSAKSFDGGNGSAAGSDAPITHEVVNLDELGL